MSRMQNRLLLLDLQKIMMLFSIQTFHVWEFIVYTDTFVIPGSRILQTFQYYSRVFPLAGQVLVAAIFLLFGVREKSRNALLSVCAFTLMGQVALLLAFMENGSVFFEWDIYAYLFTTTLLLIFIPRKSFPIAVVSFLLLWIPSSMWQELFPPGIPGDILTGRTGEHTAGAWPLLPWFFLAQLFFQLGTLTAAGKLNLSRWHQWETFFWPIAVGFSLPVLGAYFVTPIGPKYYLFAFHQNPYVFWGNFLPFIIWTRISFLDEVITWAGKKKFLVWISTLAWTRHLGLSYVIAVLYVGLAAQFDQYIIRHPFVLDTFYLSVMPVTEIIARIILKLKKKL